MKVRLTLLAGVVIGAIVMFIFLAGQDAEAPRKEFVRLIDPVVYIDNNPTPCSVPPPSRACRISREAGK